MSANLEVVISGAMKLRTSFLQEPPSVVLDKLFPSFIKSLYKDIIYSYIDCNKV